jgi:hypothetical protein
MENFNNPNVPHVSNAEVYINKVAKSNAEIGKIIEFVVGI